MKDRAKIINGELEIIPDNGKGMTIQFTSEIPQTGYWIYQEKV